MKEMKITIRLQNKCKKVDIKIYKLWPKIFTNKKLIYYALSMSILHPFYTLSIHGYMNVKYCYILNYLGNSGEYLVEYSSMYGPYFMF